MEDRDDYYERIQEIPYETIESAKKELFETLKWQKTIEQIFIIFSKIRKEKENNIITLDKEWELLKIFTILSRILNFWVEEALQESNPNLQESIDEDIAEKINYFKNRFKKYKISSINISVFNEFKYIIECFLTVTRQVMMRAKLHAKLLTALPEENLDIIEFT